MMLNNNARRVEVFLASQAYSIENGAAINWTTSMTIISVVVLIPRSSPITVAMVTIVSTPSIKKK